MTQKQIEAMGFVHTWKGFYVHKCNMELEFKILPNLKAAHPETVIAQYYDAVFSTGVEAGKAVKLSEIKTILEID